MVLKIILGVIAFVALSVAAVYLYGYLLPEERIISRTIFVNADPITVYNLAVDIEGQTSWRKDVLDVTVGSDEKSWVEHTKQGDVKLEITDVDAPRSFSLSLQGQGFHGEWAGTFDHSGSGTEVSLTETINIENPFFRFLSKVMKYTEKFMDAYAHELKTEAERRHANQQ
ncbi:MAG: SRPBCC family protein [Hyphomicrobiales bacterium]|nr:SRPBCC family protein [Hyphomicrobiales bacterium]MCY4048247.1 SRPBCC family protein [Hyphomicrobiales bacterium]MCY4053530.1 SRPBCC family protein [Hyphomicrobiales bacterium]